MSEAEKNVSTNILDIDANGGVLGQCALCDAENVLLKESHSIPKFVYQWLKETSKTPYLRSSDNVNVRHQDGPKEHLLCGDCEGKLAVLERELSKQLFKKIANYRQQSSVVTITESMRVAVLSVFWRALLTTKSHENTRTEEDSQELESFLASAKSDIRADRCMTTIYFTPFYGNPPYYDLPISRTYPLERSIGGQDMRFFDSPHRFFATFKLPFMYFHIFGDGWSVDEIDKSTEFSAGKLNLSEIEEIPDMLRSYIEYQHKAYLASLPMMDEKNLEQIRADVAKNNSITGSDKSRARSEPDA